MVIAPVVLFILDQWYRFYHISPQARSSVYATDVANGPGLVFMLMVKIRRHVCVGSIWPWIFAAPKKDVGIDLVCYRRHGHMRGMNPVIPAADVRPYKGKINWKLYTEMLATAAI
jgi:hypothetical protein